VKNTPNCGSIAILHKVEEKNKKQKKIFQIRFCGLILKIVNNYFIFDSYIFRQSKKVKNTPGFGSIAILHKVEK